MPQRRKITPPPLKWLTGKRARIDGDIARIERTAKELAPHVQAVERKLECLKEQEQSCRALAAQLRDERTALDKAILLWNPTLDPQGISAIEAWAGRYGKRGDLVKAVKDILRKAGPRGLSTTEIYELVAKKFRLVHATKVERGRWIGGSLRDRLRKMLRAGVISRTTHRTAQNQVEAVWHWVGEKAPTLDDLRGQADTVKERMACDA